MLRCLTLGTLTCLIAFSLAWAGGFYLTIGNPSASTDPAASNGLLLVQVDGCANPAEAKLRAVAKNGGRVVPLDVVPLKKTEMFVLRGNEAKRGEWTVVVTAQHLGYEWTTVVPLRDGAFDRKTITQSRRRLDQATD